MDSRILRLMDLLCERNVHFVVTSAKRDVQTNTRCGGVKNSAHLVGCAVDIAPYPCVNLGSFADLLAELQPDYDQIIIYKTFVHFGVSVGDELGRKMFIRKY